MNPYTGHLVALKPGDNLPEGYEPIPEELLMHARAKLARRERTEVHSVLEATVNVRSRTPLAQWAKKKRLAKLAAKSRRANRR